MADLLWCFSVYRQLHWEYILNVRLAIAEKWLFDDHQIDKAEFVANIFFSLGQLWLAS